VKRNKKGITKPIYSSNDSNVSANAGISGVGISGAQQVGDGTTATAGVNSSYGGNTGLNVGVQQQVSDNTTVHAGVGVNGDGTANVGVGGNTQVNDELTVGGGVGIGTDGNIGPYGSVRAGDSDAATAGGAVGQVAGTIVGGYYGGPVGAVAGGTAGGAAGSVAGQGFNDIYEGEGSGYGTAAAIFSPIGSSIAYGAGKLFGSNASKETGERKGVYSGLEQVGLIRNGEIVNPDGSKLTIAEGDENPNRAWTNADLRQDKAGDRGLFNYETDYTNDLDYVAGISGIALSRILVGDAGKSIDQAGGLLGNSFLASTGYGKQMTEENFNKVITNARSKYKEGGVDSKDEMLALSDKMLADGRVNEMDHHQMQLAADIVFDGNYDEANKSLAGRHDGVKSANKTPDANAANKAETKGAGKLDVPTGMSNDSRNRPGRVYGSGGILSPEEVMMTVQPLIDIYDQRRAQATKKPGAADNIAMAAGMYGLLNKVTGGQLNTILGDLAKSGVKGAKEIYEQLKDYYNDDSVVGEPDPTGGAFDYSGEDVPIMEDEPVDPTGGAFDYPDTSSDYSTDSETSSTDPYEDIFSADDAGGDDFFSSDDGGGFF
jgi:hypothetical protein